MDESREFYTLHLPHLVHYVVPVLQKKKDDIEIGSGVLVKVNGRHFVATAKHCIDARVRVMRSTDPTKRSGVTSSRELHILGRGWHDTLDLGYLEIADPECAELGWDQLCTDQIVGGMVQIVGYPEVLVEKIQRMTEKLTDVSLSTGTFGTTLEEESEVRMAFSYPAIGEKYDETTGAWRQCAFPKTPRGFSGGACFGVAKSQGDITQVQYNLLAIQYAWNERDCVYAIPIKQWCDLLVQRRLI